MATGSALPKYIQISEMLIRDIAAGRLGDGMRLPPERDMAKSLDISVGTLRKALADLESKGALRRLQGSGNYVQAPKKHHRFIRFPRRVDYGRWVAHRACLVIGSCIKA